VPATKKVFLQIQLPRTARPRAASRAESRCGRWRARFFVRRWRTQNDKGSRLRGESGVVRGSSAELRASNSYEDPSTSYTSRSQEPLG
jgi:hypothetical protein